MHLYRTRLNGVARARNIAAMQIAGIPVLLSAPYSAGHICTSAEAKALNDKWAAGVWANFAPVVQAARPITPEKEEALRAQFANYAANYVLGNTRQCTSDMGLFQEAVRLAKLDIEALLRRRGGRMPPEEVSERAVGLVQANPKYLERAKARRDELLRVALSNGPS